MSTICPACKKVLEPVDEADGDTILATCDKCYIVAVEKLRPDRQAIQRLCWITGEMQGILNVCTDTDINPNRADLKRWLDYLVLVRDGLITGTWKETGKDAEQK